MRFLEWVRRVFRRKERDPMPRHMCAFLLSDEGKFVIYYFDEDLLITGDPKDIENEGVEYGSGDMMEYIAEAWNDKMVGDLVEQRQIYRMIYEKAD